MDWEKWRDWKERNYIAVVLFILAYIATIPIRGYEFLDRFIDTSQGVSMWTHLVIIVFGVIILLVLLGIIERVLRR